MPLSPTRTIRAFRHAVFCDGIDDYAKIEPFTVYGWSEITIEDYVYFHHPKANAMWSKHSMIGDHVRGFPATFFESDGRLDYTFFWVYWVTRNPDGSASAYRYIFYTFRNQWVHAVRRFTSTREFSFWLNGSKVYSVSIPSSKTTIIEQNPDTATYPDYFRRFVLGTAPWLGDYHKVSQSYLRIYSRVLRDDEILHNYLYPYNPIRNGLVLWLMAHPDYIKDIDGDGVLEWIDLSGNGNHAKLYGATLVELIKPPSR